VLFPGSKRFFVKFAASVSAGKRTRESPARHQTASAGRWCIVRAEAAEPVCEAGALLPGDEATGSANGATRTAAGFQPLIGKNKGVA